MRAGARIVMLVLAMALLGLPSAAAAQDSAPCDVYPEQCPPKPGPNGNGDGDGDKPPTTYPTPTYSTPPQGVQGVQGTAVTSPPAVPGQQVEDLPGGGPDEAGQGDGGDSAAQPSRAAGPITVNLPRRGGPGRCWYAIVHLDTERDDMEEDIERALGEPCYVATMRAPVDIDGLNDLLEDSAFGELGTDDDGLANLRRLGREVGGQLVTPEQLVYRVEDVMFSEVEREIQKVSAIVVTHDEHDLDGDEDRAREVLARALVHGMRTEEIPATNGGLVPVPVIGVEFTTTDPSWVPWYKAREISSVDNIDQRVGRRALSLLATGAKPGHYGVKDSAEALLPPAGSGAAPVRFRAAGAISAPADTASGIETQTALMMVLLTLTAGWAIGLAGRRTVRRRLARDER